VVWFVDLAEKVAVGLLFGLGTGDRGLTCRNSGNRGSGNLDEWTHRLGVTRRAGLKRVKNVSTLGLHWRDAVRIKDKSPNLPSMLSLLSREHLRLYHALCLCSERHV
jgi:hypothetical protein